MLHQLRPAQEDDISLLKRKVATLEAAVDKLTQAARYQNESGRDGEIGPSEVIANVSDDNPRLLPGTHNEHMYKTRLRGRSHWLTVCNPFMDIFPIIRPWFMPDSSQDMADLLKCKQLGRTIKIQRQAAGELAASTLPSQDIMDQLINNYLRISESLYRVIDAPALIKDYRAFLAMLEQSVSIATPPILQLVFAIGASVYDDEFSLRATAHQWIREAQEWLRKLGPKSQLTIEALQVSILSLLAREVTGLDEESVWISVGSLIRTAMAMGLHRDPERLGIRSEMHIEQRRRLWNTIIELALQSSMDTGTLPLISLEDFDTAPPEAINNDRQPDPCDTLFQCSTAAELRKSFGIRLEVAKFLNGVKSSRSYDEVLRLDKELREARSAFWRTFQAQSSPMENQTPSLAIWMAGLKLDQCLLSLHVPFCDAEAAHAFSRQTVRETAVHIWRMVGAPLPANDQHVCSLQVQQDLTRLAICGRNFVQIAALQSSFALIAELRASQKEPVVLQRPSFRPEFASIMDEIRAFTIRTIEAGETSIKCHLLQGILAADMDGHTPRRTKQEQAQQIADGAQLALAQCLEIMQRKAGDFGGADMGGRDQVHEDALAFADMFAEDWSFMLCTPLFDDNFFTLPP